MWPPKSVFSPTFTLLLDQTSWGHAYTKFFRMDSTHPSHRRVPPPTKLKQQCCHPPTRQQVARRTHKLTYPSYRKFARGTHTRLPIKVTRWTFTISHPPSYTVEGNAQLTHSSRTAHAQLTHSSRTAHTHPSTANLPHPHTRQQSCQRDMQTLNTIDISKSSGSCLGAIKRNYTMEQDI